MENCLKKFKEDLLFYNNGVKKWYMFMLVDLNRFNMGKKDKRDWDRGNILC